MITVLQGYRLRWGFGCVRNAFKAGAQSRCEFIDGDYPFLTCLNWFTARLKETSLVSNIIVRCESRT